MNTFLVLFGWNRTSNLYAKVKLFHQSNGCLVFTCLFNDLLLFSLLVSVKYCLLECIEEQFVIFFDLKKLNCFSLY